MTQGPSCSYPSLSTLGGRSGAIAGRAFRAARRWQPGPSSCEEGAPSVYVRQGCLGENLRVSILLVLEPVIAVRLDVHLVAAAMYNSGREDFVRQERSPEAARDGRVVVRMHDSVGGPSVGHEPFAAP
jgi:hypothetical protein